MIAQVAITSRTGWPVGLALPGLTAGGRTVVLSAAQGSTVTGHLTAATASWGTRLSWDCSYGDDTATALHRGTRYEMTVTTTDGRIHEVAAWTAADTTSTDLAASVAFPLNSIDSVAIRTSTGTPPLATAEL